VFVKLKNFVKHLAYMTVQRGRPFAPLKILAGPLKGVCLNLDLRTQSSYWIGAYDNWILRRVPLCFLIRPGQTAWDGGAYVGFYSALLRACVGKSGKVHAFEASPSNFRNLRGIGGLNQWSNVHVHDVAIGPDHSEITFASEEGGASGPVGLVEGSRSFVSRGLVKVKSCGVDELIEEEGVAAPDFMKLDLETGEIFALANGGKLYETRRPTILLELHGRECLAAAVKFAERYDYHLADIWVLPSTGPEAVIANPRNWIAAYRSASKAFLGSPPHDPPHMTLAIHKERLNELEASVQEDHPKLDGAAARERVGGLRNCSRV
jgi:FkbM family methyltransferase